MPSPTFPLFATFSTLLLAFLTGCETVPGTGRSALNIMPENMMAQMGASSFAELKGQEKISANPKANAMLRRVGGKVATVAEPDFRDSKPNWEFVVFESADINAFALPGGKVGVYTGLLDKITLTDDELAIVVGHEVAHVTARHGNERLSQQLLAGAGGMALSAWMNNKDVHNKELYIAAYGAGVQYGVILPFSRDHESEADRIGLMYAARAGYDPRAALTVWKRMGDNSGTKPPEWLSTHPSEATRTARLTRLMPEALVEYTKTTGKTLSWP